MRKVIAMFLCVLGTNSLIHGQSAGGGISVFFPETLYKHYQGTLAFEQGFSTSMGFGQIISLPLGFAYHSVDGFVVEHPDLSPVDGPAFYGDSIIPYAMLKAKIPLKTLYIEAFGGGSLAWAFSMNPTGRYFPATLAQEGDTYVAFKDLTLEKKLGYGWLAGGAIGVQFGKIGVDLGATYRNILMPMDISTTFVRVSGTTATEYSQTFAGAVALLRGVSIRIGGNFSF